MIIEKQLLTRSTTAVLQYMENLNDPVIIVKLGTFDVLMCNP